MVDMGDIGDNGALPAATQATVPTKPLSLYLHVPFCHIRCGYCDFNTYTATDLGAGPGSSKDDYLASVGAELALARRVLGQPPPVGTVFAGGGTPTVLQTGHWARLLGSLRDEFVLSQDAEVTIEANPETLTPRFLADLVALGFNRLSLGMQSAVPGVLATLERRHTPGRAVRAVGWAREAGFSSVNLDLIYGTPGESLDDWRHSLDVALSVLPDHVSAYALTLEDGTPLAARIRRGELPMIDDDDAADKYLLAEETLTASGFHAYEVSNWAQPGHECRHNLAYWHGANWWGFGPGAHSHVGGVRWWNVTHPRHYSQRLQAGVSPAAGREILTEAERHTEQVLLQLRLSSGLPLSDLSSTESARVPRIISSGLGRVVDQRLVLTVSGRLLADAVVRTLLD